MKKVAAQISRNMYEHIVIAVDGGYEAKRAAQRGLQLARDFDANVAVLSVVEQKALQLTETSDEKAHLRERGEMASRKPRDLRHNIARLFPRNCWKEGPLSKSASTLTSRTQT
jgi:K+-sensing histidine kinase KdpD